MTDDLIARNRRYLASYNGENDLKVGPAMLAFALEESTERIAALEAAAEIGDLLTQFQRHLNWELSFEGWEDSVWQVHAVNGGRSDREWTLIATGESAIDAIRQALEANMTDTGRHE